MIFIVRQLQEKHQEKKNLYYTFVDLKKGFGRISREVTPWILLLHKYLSLEPSGDR
jgi:hypothetical protein